MFICFMQIDAQTTKADMYILEIAFWIFGNIFGILWINQQCKVGVFGLISRCFFFSVRKREKKYSKLKA